MRFIGKMRLKKILCCAAIGIAALSCGHSYGNAAPAATHTDVSTLASNVVHANVDASIYLDYEAGRKPVSIAG